MTLGDNERDVEAEDVQRPSDASGSGDASGARASVREATGELQALATGASGESISSAAQPRGETVSPAEVSHAAPKPPVGTGDESVPHPEAWREVMAEVSRLRSEVDELNRLCAEVSRLRSEVAAAQMMASLPGEDASMQAGSVAAGGTRHKASEVFETASPDGAALPARNQRWSRRGLLLGAAGGAASVTVAVAGAAPAAATPGSPLIIGAENDGGATQTKLTSANGVAAVYVENTGVGSSFIAFNNSAGNAIQASARTGSGVAAESADGNAVLAKGLLSGTGLRATAWRGAAAALFSAEGPTVRLSNGRSAVPSTGSWEAGDVVAVKTDGGSRMELWVCVASGSPGLWRQVAGPSVAGGFVPIKPIRVYDSRWSGVPGVVTGQLLPGTMRTVSVADARDSSGAISRRDAIPRGTSAVTLNVTVVDTVGRGNLALVPDGAGGSETSSINWSADGQVLANGLTVGIDTFARTLDIICRSNRTNAVVDITGYYAGA